MNGRDLLLILAHLFRKKGNPVHINDAVEFISFKCRYGRPSQVRRILTMAIDSELITRAENYLNAEFLYDRQTLSPNLVSLLSDKIGIENNIEQMF